MDTQTQVERLIELAIVQRTELRQLVEQLPQLREHLNAEIERTFEEAEPQIRTELEEFCAARATDEHAKTGAALAAKVDELSKQLEATTSAKYSVLMAERAHNVELERIATEQVAQAAKEIPSQVKAIVADELSRFPRAGEIDQLRKEFATPAGLNPRGKWQSGQTYERLDVVSYNGNSYIANGKTSEKPSADSTSWTINAARGTGGGGPSSLNELTQTPTNGSVLIGSGTSWVTSTLTAGTGISIANAAGSITINATDGNITLDDGTAAAPSLNFTNEPTTGLFRASANVMGFAVAGVSRATMTTTGVTVTGTITPTGSVHAAAGSVGNPSVAFSADQDTGLFNIGANNLGVAIGGAKVLDIATTGLGITGLATISSIVTASEFRPTGGAADWAQATLAISANSTYLNSKSGYVGYLSNNATAILGWQTGYISILPTTASTGVGTGALQVAGGIYAGAASVFAADLTVNTLRVGAGNGTATYNTALGYQALNGANSGSGRNTAIGYTALTSNTTGDSNMAIGFEALSVGTTFVGNIGIGSQALKNTTGSYSVGIGLQALYTGTSANRNTAVGSFALYTTNGTNNVAMGYGAGSLATGNNKFYVGNVQQSSEANDAAYSLLYGTFSGSAGSLTGQTLAINAVVSIQNTVGSAVAVASTHKVTMVIGGVTYYLLATNVP